MVGPRCLRDHLAARSRILYHRRSFNLVMQLRPRLRVLFVLIHGHLVFFQSGLELHALVTVAQVARVLPNILHVGADLFGQLHLFVVDGH